MKKLIMVLAVCLLLSGTLAASGTLAFPNISEVFSGLINLLGLDNGMPTEDETIFKVELVSQARDGSGNLVRTTEVPMLLPAVSKDDLEAVSTDVDGKIYSLWESRNGIADKFVSVANRSVVDTKAEPPVPHDAYFRIAFAVQEEAFPLLYLNFNREDYEWTDWKEIKIDGRAYRMIVATYDKPLAVNEVSPAALMQVALDRETTSADADKIAGDFIQIQVMAIDSAPFNEKNMTASEALNAALPLENLNPF